MQPVSHTPRPAAIKAFTLKIGRWNAEQPFVLSTVEAFAPGNVEA